MGVCCYGGLPIVAEAIITAALGMHGAYGGQLAHKRAGTQRKRGLLLAEARKDPNF